MRDKLSFLIFIFLHADLNCEKNNKTKVNFFPSTYHMECAAHELNQINIKMDTSSTEMDYDFQHKTIQDIDIDKKTKHFLSFMRGMHRPQKALASYFEHNDLWYNNIISFLKIEWDVLAIYQKYYLKNIGKVLEIG